MSRRQHTTPVVIKEDRVRLLKPVPYSERSYDEAWLQKLLFEHPQLLPAHELEPGFKRLVPVCRELPTGAGPVDVLYVTADGFLALAETKLWRNPQARREVVAQIIDYAKDMAGWSYEQLEAAAQRGDGFPRGMTLVELVTEVEEDVDEATFIDAVSRNLRSGRFLLLVVGDGIREDVEQMAEFLQQTPHLHFTLGLVELAMFRLGDPADAAMLVQPRVVMRTTEVTRAVVELKVPEALGDVQIQVALPAEEPPTKRTRHKLTEDEFFEQLEKNAEPEAVQFARDVLDATDQHQLTVEWMDAGPSLRYVHQPTGVFFTMGQLSRHGRLASVDRFFDRCEMLNLPDEVYKRYFDEMAALVPGATRKRFTKATGRWEGETVVYGPNPTALSQIPLAELAPRIDAWFGVIDRAITRIDEAMEERGEVE